MNNAEQIKELIRDLDRENIKMSGGMNIEAARRMLVVSECITASLQGYLFRFLSGYRTEIENSTAKPIPSFYR